AGIARGIRGAVRALAAEKGDDAALAVRRVRDDLRRGDRRRGEGRHVHTVASARSSASEKPPTVTAPWGQTVTQTPQPMHTPGSEKATSTGVAAMPPWSIEVTRAAAALA